MTTRVIDLSHHNTIPESLKPARAMGIAGVIHKCTEGLTVVDKKVGARRSLANDAGMLWGLYHFIRPGNILGQAAFFLDTSKGIFDEGTLFALDYEDNRVSLDDVVAFLEMVEETTHRTPILYSGHVLKEALGGIADQRLTRYPIWVAQYGPKCDLPPGWDSYWLWQFTDQGKVDGINPPVDLNDYQGSEAQLAFEWTGAGSRPISPPSKPAPAPAEVTVTVKGNATVNVKYE